MSEDIFQPTDIVLAKVKGYPPWPAIIVPEEIIPQHILEIRPRQHAPITTGASKAVSRRPQYIRYSDELRFKKFETRQDHYCVKFFADDSYLWVKVGDISALGHRDTSKWLKSGKKKQKRLVPAYEIADKVLSQTKRFDVVKFVELGSGEEMFAEEEVSVSAGRKRTQKQKRRADNEGLQEETNNKKRRRKKDDGSNSSQKGEDQTIHEETVTSTPDLKRKTRLTRSRTSKNVTPESEQKLDLQSDSGDTQPELVDEIPTRTSKRRTGKTTASASKSKPAAKTKKVKPEPKPKPKPVIEKYNYEDDENWAVVGLGPQDSSIDKNVSSVVRKLSVKKNMDTHQEKKLDLMDRITSINSRLFDLFRGIVDESEEKPEEKSKEQDQIPSKESYELILDEFDSVLNTKGAKNEFITVLRSNNELILNFRFLFNAKRHELENFGLWDAFLDIYEAIYHYRFVPDKEEWDLNANNVQDTEMKSKGDDVIGEASQVKSEPLET